MKQILLLTCCILNTMTHNAQNTSPKAVKKAQSLELHGHSRNDDYFWMKERDSKEILAYLGEENKYAETYFNPLQSLVKSLMLEFDKRINPNDISAPFILNGKKYQVRNEEKLDYQKVILIEKEKETVYFDENIRAKNHSFYELADWSPSPDNKLLAVSEDFVGRRKYDISIRINKSGKFLTDRIIETSGSIVWANDNKTIFYIKKDPQTLREFQVFRHEIGSDSNKDILVFEEKDEKYSVGISNSETRGLIFISCYSSTTSEQWWIDSNQPNTLPVVFIPRSAGHLYEISDHPNGYYILSNHDAVNKKVCFSATAPSSITECSEFIPHDPAVLIESVSCFKDFILLEERKNGLLKLKLKNLKDGNENYISFNEETYFVGLGLNDDINATSIFYNYNSMTTPSSVYQYNLVSGEQSLWFRRTLIDTTFLPENYASQRIWATANDGTKIPISMVYKKGIELSKAPCLLYGYGSYGYTLPDVFSATRLSLLDRGFVYAVAHIRGSKYMGEEWYENGKFQRKINTFTDFINAAEFMGHMGYCDKDKIYAQGGSAGGLLMGAVTNMAPYLWKGVVSQVPFVDVVTTMLDETIPLTTGEYEEWGNPNDPEFYYYMLKYSPYDNIHAMDYPAMYITTGYHDSQVQYWEPAKYVAKLREYKTDDHPLIFECNMDAGHGGGSGRKNERLEIAKVYAFILGLEGIRK
jgi:oligopeptidase B